MNWTASYAVQDHLQASYYLVGKLNYDSHKLPSAGRDLIKNRDLVAFKDIIPALEEINVQPNHLPNLVLKELKCQKHIINTNQLD